MNKIPKTEVSVKEFQKLLAQVKKNDKTYSSHIKNLDSKMNTLQKTIDSKFNSQYKMLDSKINTQYINIEKKIASVNKNFDTRVNVQKSEFNQKLKKSEANSEKQQNILSHDIGAFRGEIELLRKEIQLIQRNIQEHVKTQEEIIMDMIRKFHDQNMKQNQIFASQIEDIKNQQDIMKISFTLNEKQLLEKLGKLVREELKSVIRDSEKEVLMKMWIEELRGIVKSFDTLKKARPKEFSLRINEIVDTIEMFKEKIAL